MPKMRNKQKEWKEKSRKKKTLGVATLLTFAFFLSAISAQQSLNTTGATAIGTGGSATYTVGQVVYTTNSSTSGLVAQGVQQPYEIFEIAEDNEDPVAFPEIHKGVTLSVSAKFSPSTDRLLLQVPNLGASKITFELFSLQGKRIQSHNITQMQTEIDMSHLGAAPYIAKIMQGSATIKTFKIIKN
jgi:hypothetical protein